MSSTISANLFNGITNVFKDLNVQYDKEGGPKGADGNVYMNSDDVPIIGEIVDAFKKGGDAIEGIIKKLNIPADIVGDFKSRLEGLLASNDENESSFNFEG